MDFVVPQAIKGFINELHYATRNSRRADVVQLLYDADFKEITEKFFDKTAWPEPSAIAIECDKDEGFLLFYREMTLRHLFTKLKPHFKDFIESWNNYTKVKAIFQLTTITINWLIIGTFSNFRSLNF